MRWPPGSPRTTVKAGEVGHECRLVAIRASGAVARKRRKRRRREARAKGVAPDAAGLIRDGWHLMLTNLPVAGFAPKLLCAIYRARWGSGNPVPRVEPSQ
ncbi:MAG: hypothetical protein P1U81_16670 [Verrucomicrobiales bacterium]|nr:hypothetical protein [Verrucomicrobiales bacterium]